RWRSSPASSAARRTGTTSGNSVCERVRRSWGAVPGRAPSPGRRFRDRLADANAFADPRRRSPGAGAPRSSARRPRLPGGAPALRDDGALREELALPLLAGEGVVDEQDAVLAALIGLRRVVHVLERLHEGLHRGHLGHERRVAGGGGIARGRRARLRRRIGGRLLL